VQAEGGHAEREERVISSKGNEGMEYDADQSSGDAADGEESGIKSPSATLSAPHFTFLKFGAPSRTSLGER